MTSYYSTYCAKTTSAHASKTQTNIQMQEQPEAAKLKDDCLTLDEPTPSNDDMTSDLKQLIEDLIKTGK